MRMRTPLLDVDPALTIKAHSCESCMIWVHYEAWYQNDLHEGSMTSDSTTQPVATLVENGIAAFRNGDKSRAYELLSQALQRDPRNELAWLWMSAVVIGHAERRYCLERVLEINPQHTAARQGVHSFPPDVEPRSPLPAAAQPPAGNQCSHPGCAKLVSRPGHTLCYEHWKASRSRPQDQATPSFNLLVATQLSERLDLSSRRVNLLFAELGWIERQQQGWIVTAQGQALGGEQRHHPQTNTPFVVWPESILTNNVFQTAVKHLGGEDTSSTSVADNHEQNFRDRFPAQHRTTDGHFVRSKAEVLIDNWLYMSGIVHAYERQLPVEEQVYCDFYLPAGKVYIEYWGFENDPIYSARRKIKQAVYRKYRLNLIELADEHIRNLDDYLPQVLLKFGISVL